MELPLQEGSGTNSIIVNFANSAFVGNFSVYGTNICFSGDRSPNLKVIARALLTGQVSLNNLTIPATHQECLEAQSITTAGSGTTFLIEGGGEVTLIAGQFILCLPGTAVRETGYFHALITNQCIPCSSMKFPVSDPNLLSSGETGEAGGDLVDRSFIKIYPNPTPGSFSLEWEGKTALDKVQVEIYSAQGKKILTEKLSGEHRHIFSLSDRPVGVYFIRVISGTGVETFKVIRQ